MTWQPNADFSALRKRAELMQDIRDYFAETGALEVETPLLSLGTITDPHIDALTTQLNQQTYYLQTSPEYAMKRLLASGSGDIFQICKAFRDGEQGHQHNSEFSMLEWYRVGKDHFELMQDITSLLVMTLDIESVDLISYQTVFLEYVGIDPFDCTAQQLQQVAKKNDIDCNVRLTKDDWLNLLMSKAVEPRLDPDQATFIYHYPASQAALAKISQQEEGLVAERFECFYQGFELANGYHEEANKDELLKRFEQDNQLRQQLGKTQRPIDQRFMDAMPDMPACAGVALGLDRLVMIATEAETIQQVLAFDQSRA